MMIGFFAAARSSATAVDLGRVGGGSADHPVPLVEEIGGEVVGVGLDVLGEGQHHGAGLDRVDEGAHRGRERGEQLLGAGDPVEEPGRPGRKASLTVRSASTGCWSCCSTGPWWRVA